MDDLVQWIGEQLDADEKVVRDELCVNCGNPIVPLRSPLGITGYSHGGGRVSEDGEWERSWEGRRCQGSITGAEAVQNPARVLREIDSKRRLLDDLLAEKHLTSEEDTWYACAALVDEDGDPVCPNDARAPGPCDCGRDDRVLRRLRLLALPHADRPGYQESWRP